MHRRLFAIAMAVAAGGCSVTAPTVAFTAVCAPPTATTCTFSATCDAQYIGLNVMDVSVTNQFWLVVEAHNQATDNSDANIGRVNTHNAYVQQIDVTYEGALAIPGTSTRMQEMVPAEGTAVLSIFPVPAGAGLGPGSVAAGTSAVVVAKVKAKGVFGDGTDFESPVFEVPVEVCNGCVGSAGGASGPLACPAGQTLAATCPPTDGQLPMSVACQ
jgi:hypothetical protein